MSASGSSVSGAIASIQKVSNGKISAASNSSNVSGDVVVNSESNSSLASVSSLTSQGSSSSSDTSMSQNGSQDEPQEGRVNSRHVIFDSALEIQSQNSNAAAQSTDDLRRDSGDAGGAVIVHRPDVDWLDDLQHLLNDVSLVDHSDNVASPLMYSRPLHIPPLIATRSFMNSGKHDGNIVNRQPVPAPRPRIRRFGQTGRRINMSFNNDRFLDIQKENQRLLKAITKKRMSIPHTGPNSQQYHRSVSAASTRRAASPNSVFQRKTQQERIQQDNMLLLRKIQSAKPSPALSRSHLRSDYIKSYYGVQYPGGRSRSGFGNPGYAMSRSSSLSRLNF